MNTDFKISIGMPVYNGGQTIKAALEALLNQTYKEFELIISDNASTDETQAICEAYALRDDRIRYVRQPKNLGSAGNFKYVLDEAIGEYFLWAADDDIRSKDFLEVNLEFLENNPDFVASTVRTFSKGKIQKEKDLITFPLDAETPEERIFQFFDNCWKSNGIFYSLMRSKVLKQCDLVGQHFIASDWAIDLFMAIEGPIHRTNKGLTTLGANGISNQKNSYKAFRNHPIEVIIPFYKLSFETLVMTSDFSVRDRTSLFKRLVYLNIYALYNQFYAKFYPHYYAYIRPWLRRRK